MLMNITFFLENFFFKLQKVNQSSLVLIGKFLARTNGDTDHSYRDASLPIQIIN